MTRLGARWTHFWAKGKIYRHFWQATEELVFPADGATVAVTASLISGAVASDASINGVTMTVDASAISGLTTQDGIAPLNTRLNARYRHFWGRKRTWRHFWAQYEGVGIFGTLADGQLIVSSVSFLEQGDVHADANLAGPTLTVSSELVQGDDQVIEPGEPDLTVTLLIIPGTGHGGANADGITLTLWPYLIPGRSPLDFSAELIDGITSVIEPGDVLPVITSVIGGEGSGAANQDGDTIVVTTEIIQGQTYVPPDALAIPEPLDAVDVELIAGFTQSDAFNVGGTFPIECTLIAGTGAGHATAQGATFSVGVSIVAGVAAGDTPLPEYQRVAGPVSYRKRPKEQDAQAFGKTVKAGAKIVPGKATGETLSLPPEWIPSAPPLAPGVESPAAPVLTQVPEEASQARGDVAMASTSIEGGKASVDWTNYDAYIVNLLGVV